MKVALLALGFAIVCQPLLATPAYDREWEVLGGRLFPTLTRLDASAEPVRKLLEERHHRYTACGADVACKITAAAWSDAESDALARVGDGEEQRLAVKRELAGLNSILAVYGSGAKPRYPLIDGPDTAADENRFKADVTTAVALSEQSNDPVAALDPSLGLSLALLDVSGRLDAAAFEPLNTTENQTAMKRSRTIDWSHYRYTALIVLGVGPDDLATPLSARGKFNVRQAAKSYFEGLAPFIIVTGGKVHPRGARFAEAVEMRRALIERYKVPADAVVLEPYARHTTTNLRNATRLLMAMHAPLDRDTLVITTAEHSRYVESEEFRNRNLRELGYLPGTVGERLSPFAVAFRPAAISARVDPGDPLDP